LSTSTYPAQTAGSGAAGGKGDMVSVVLSPSA
jgi:hypothetical protein